MKRFQWQEASKIEDAFLADGSAVMAIAGGTELLNWMRLGIVAPDRLIDLGRVGGLNSIAASVDRLSIGALATLNEVGEHPLVRRHAQVLAEACLKAASAQIRNRATLGGNVLQKTRCEYFRAEAPLPWNCNKRLPGSGCAARHGLNERHAIFGWSDACVAVQPSDPVVALAALDADVELRGPQGMRMLPVVDLLVTPSEAADSQAAPVATAGIETRLRPGEVIAGYHLKVTPGLQSAYVKVRERASYEYALVSAGVALSMKEGRIARARIALGSVAMKPWRLLRAEHALVGEPPTREAVLPALEAELAAARPLAHNAYKVKLAANTAMRAIVEAGAVT